jgi:hypothetical protein
LNIVGSLLLLGAAAAVVVFVILPLLTLGDGGGGSGQPTASPTAQQETPAAPDRVTVPDTVGMATDDAIEAASDAGLDWTVRCAQDPQRPEGIIDQEPAPGAEVAPGSPFTMYSARIEDCR